jgi:hypothetical protein
MTSPNHVEFGSRGGSAAIVPHHQLIELGVHFRIVVLTMVSVTDKIPNVRRRHRPAGVMKVDHLSHHILDCRLLSVDVQTTGGYKTAVNVVAYMIFVMCVSPRTCHVLNAVGEVTWPNCAAVWQQHHHIVGQTGSNPRSLHRLNQAIMFTPNSTWQPTQSSAPYCPPTAPSEQQHS